MKTLEIVRNIDGQEVEKLNENPQGNLNKIQDLENVNPGSAVMPTGMIQGTPSFKIFLESTYKRTAWYVSPTGEWKVKNSASKMAEEGCFHLP